MWRFLVDEDMPRSTARILREHGYLADDVRDVGLRGQSDAKVFAFAQTQKCVLVTGDKGFANILRYPPGKHAGIIVMRVPNTLPTAELNRALIRALDELADEELAGLLVIVELGRIRVWRG